MWHIHWHIFDLPLMSSVSLTFYCIHPFIFYNIKMQTVLCMRTNLAQINSNVTHPLPHPPHTHTHTHKVINETKIFHNTSTAQVKRKQAEGILLHDTAMNKPSALSTAPPRIHLWASVLLAFGSNNHHGTTGAEGQSQDAELFQTQRCHWTRHSFSWCTENCSWNNPV